MIVDFYDLEIRYDIWFYLIFCNVGRIVVFVVN